MTDVANIIDLERYPIGNLQSKHTQALVAIGRQQLADTALFTLPGFIRAEALAAMQQEALRLLAEGYRHESHRDGIAAAEPRLTRVSLNCAGFDQMADDSPIRQLYCWDPLTDFIGAVLERTPYYRSADPIASCMLTGLSVGDELGWHFDPNDGVVTLMIQAPTAGGLFEFAPDVRCADEVALTTVDAVINGDFPGLVRTAHQPGTLVLFNGQRALHRVSPVEQGPDRIILVLSYDSRDGQVFEDRVRLNFFGRIEPRRSR